MANKKTAVLIGNTEFPNSNNELCSLPTEDDIHNLKRILTDPALGDAEALCVIDLPHYKISTTVNKLFRDASREDQIIIYYSGHARLDNNQLYLATIDTSLEVLLTTSINARNLAKLLRGTQCRRINIIFDLYYAPPITNANLVDAVKHFFEDLKSSITDGYSLSLITAYQYLTEPFSNSSSSNLLQVITDGIESGDADANRDGSITIAELTEYIRKEFTRKGRNEPICADFGSQNSFIFSKSKAQFITKSTISKVKKKLKALSKHNEIYTTIRYNALAFLEKDQNDIEKNHQSTFKLLKEWSDNKISDIDFLSQWYQFEGTHLPETESPKQSTALKERWDIVRKFRGSMQDLIAPTYMLDQNFQFLDWNPMFDELIAKPLGLLRGRHAEDFILELENKTQVIKRSNRIYKKKLYPIVDIELLILKTKYGIVKFKKIAAKIPNDRNMDLWSVNLNIVSAENSALMWRDLRKRIKKDLNWSLYSKAYDQMLLNFDSYNELVTQIVDKLGEASNVVDLASGTGNNTIELLKKDPKRTVWALEYNQEMLEYMYDKIANLNSNVNNVNIVKGDLILSLREFDENFFDGAVMVNALYAMDDRGYCLREIYRVLKPGAILVYSSSTQDTDVEYLFKKIRENLEQKGLLDNEMKKIVSGAYERHLAMSDSIKFDSSEDVINYATAAGFIVDKEEVIEGVYEGAVTIIKAKKRQTIIPDKVLPNLKYPENRITRVFISYSHENNKFCEGLKKYLQPLMKDGKIEVWSDHNIKVGDRWRETIQTNLKESSIAILLISIDFLNSKFINNNELPSLLHAAQSEGLLIIPLILEKCLYDTTFFNYPDPKIGPHKFKLSEFQSAGSLTNTLDKLDKPELNDIFYEIAKKIKSYSDRNYYEAK